MIFLQIRELHDTEWQRDKIWPQSYTCGGRKNGNFNVYLTHGMSTDYGSVQLGIKFMHDMISVQKINLLQFLLQLTYTTKTTCHQSFRALFCLTVLVVLQSFGGFHLIHIEHRRTELMWLNFVGMVHRQTANTSRAVYRKLVCKLQLLCLCLLVDDT